MADILPMARSFYSWVAKVQLQEGSGPLSKAFPKEHPTDVFRVKLVASNLRKNLRGTLHEARANYWDGIFSSFVESELTEGKLGDFANFLKNVVIRMFTPPPESVPDDRTILGKLRLFKENLKQYWYKHIELSQRQFPTYTVLRDWFQSYEVTEMEKMLGIPPGEGTTEILTPENKTRLRWRWRCWMFAQPFQFNTFVRSMENWVSDVATVTEYGYALLVQVITGVLAVLFYGVRLVWGEKVARDIFE